MHLVPPGTFTAGPRQSSSQGGAAGLVQLAPPPGPALPALTLKEIFILKAEAKGRFHHLLSLVV